MSVAAVPNKFEPGDLHDIVSSVVERARTAQATFADASQARADEAVRALAWSIYKPEHAREVAELAVADTGLGNVPTRSSRSSARPSGPCATCCGRSRSA
jgi:sulfoacetaldehyde dehydrogenase